MQKKILITGASGFLGRYLLKLSPNEARFLAQYLTHPVNSTSENIQAIKSDLSQPSFDKLSKFRPDVIIHTAALSSIDTCELNPERAWSINFEATRGLVDVAKQNHARFIFISTDTVFDGKRGNYSEQDIPDPINVYARTKFESEQCVLNLDNAVVVRAALFYGKSLNGTPSFTQLMLEKLKAGEKVTVFTDQYRTPLPVEQLAKAIWELVNLDYRGVIHVGGRERISRSEMGVKLCQQFKLPLDLLIQVPYHQADQAALRPLDCSLDITLAQNMLETSFPDFREGLRSAFLFGLTLLACILIF
jgi:dTDP-4-dehydrorhamnose reductase